MRNKVLLLLLVIILLAGATYALFAWAAAQHRIDARGYELVKDGMTEAEVVEALRRKPGGYRTSPGGYAGLQDLGDRAWVSDSAVIAVKLSGTGVVTARKFIPLQDTFPSISERTRRWLRDIDLNEELKKTLSLSFAGIVSVLVAMLTFVTLAPVSPINRRNFDRIRVGMDLKSVQEVISLPAGDYSTGELVPEPGQIASRTGAGKRWVGDQGIITLNFNDLGKVEEKFFCAVHRETESLMERVKRWM